jgi:predicted phage terminase large subunit-like protein
LSRTAAPIPLSTPEVEVRLPALHPAQQEVLTSPARFKVVCCGRQWGKTFMAAVTCFASALRGGHVWWVAPHYQEGELAWKKLLRLAVQVPGTRVEQRPVYRITTPAGGTIQVRSADNPDSLRGATLDGLVMDEAASAKADAWNVLRPTLLIRRGWAMFISTPKGQNWFFDLFNDAAHRKGWERWQLPTSTSPFAEMDLLEADRQEMHPLVFAQEYEAQFVEGSGTIFKREDFRYYYRQEFEGKDQYVLIGAPDTERVDVDRCRRFATVDLAFSVEERADYTVIASWGVTPKRQLLLLDVIRERMEPSKVLKSLQMAFGKHRLGYLAMERAAHQMGLIRDAEQLGLPIKEIAPDRNKESRAMPAAARMERSQIFFPQGAEWLKPLEEELLAFPAGRHDDFVDCLAYAALHLASSGGGYLFTDKHFAQDKGSA